MSYTNRPSDRVDPPDMPAVSPLDMPVADEVQQQPRRRISPKSPRQVLQPEAAPPPPQRSQKVRHPLVIVSNFFVMAAVLILVAGGGALYFGIHSFNRPGPLTETTSVLIPPGADLESIALQLQRHNIIDSPLVFSMAARFNKLDSKLQAGEYLFQPSVSMKQVLDDLISGRSVLHTITFPEGLTSQMIVDKLLADPTLTGEIAAVPPDGTLMPDTYKFTRGTTRQQLLDQMERVSTRVVEEVWSHRVPGLPITTTQQFVTLASIVEKETGRADERPRVAAVFINRLNKGMRLQSDPTVIYGLFGGAGLPSGRPLYQSDLEKPTPYNTYLIPGLPPAPIANPGRAALEAVANPSRTNELYFVADGTGGHAFSATLEEHNRNVAHWRQIQEQKQNAPQGTDKPAAAPAPAPADAGAGDNNPAPDNASPDNAPANGAPAAGGGTDSD
jgi:peptidoglycan lytic transglycosylase G